MARLIQGLAGPAPAARTADPLTDLTRLLDRLQRTVLRVDADRERRLRASEFERKKLETNIKYARTLLTKMEQDALAVKIHVRRQELQQDLSRKRDILEQLMERMLDLEEMGPPDDEDDSSEGEDILGEVLATPSESLDSSTSPILPPEETSVPEVDIVEPLDTRLPETAAASSLPAEETLSEKPALATVTTQNLRSRGKDPEKGPDTAITTATGDVSSLFGDRAGNSLSPTATTEAILDHQRAEQEFLYDSLAKMAGDLKASSQAFSASLEEDKDVVNKAGEGLDKNKQGLDAAARRMGTLRKMGEGKGWWGRLFLYAYIYALMVGLILLVFVMPKLRFSTW